MDFFELSFFRNALAGAFLAAVACGIVGTYVVVRRLVFICGGITHASLGGVGIALYLGWPPLWPALAFSVLSALGIRRLAAGDKEEREDEKEGPDDAVGDHFPGIGRGQEIPVKRHETPEEVGDEGGGKAGFSVGTVGCRVRHGSG